MGVPSRHASIVTVPLAASATSAHKSTSQVFPSSIWMDAEEIRSLKFDPGGMVPGGTPMTKRGAFVAADRMRSTASSSMGRWRAASPVRLPGGRATCGGLHQPGERMADVGCVHPVAREEFRLEGEDAQQLVDDAPHQRQAALPP